MVRRPLPIAAGLEHLMRLEVAVELRRCPHMVEAAPAVILRPIRRPVAPPCEAALGRGHEPAANIDPVVRLLQPGQRVDLDRGVTNDLKKRLVAPDVAFQWSDVEVADDNRWLVEAFRPAGHAFDEIELLAELRIDGAVGRVATRGHVDVLEPDAAIEADPDMTRFAIVLPVVLARIPERNAAQDGDAVMHALAVQCVMDIAVLPEKIGGKDAVQHLGFLKAEDIRLLLSEQALDQPGPGADRVDVPGCDLQPSAHVSRLARRAANEKGPRSGGMERGPTERVSRKGPCRPG